jgi:hypothetical protein
MGTGVRACNMKNTIIPILNSKIFWIVVFLLLYFIYLYLRTRHYQKKKATEYEKLVTLAILLEKSEFDIFETSGQKWEISQERLDHDFRIYLENGTIPFYVRDYIRNNEKMIIPANEPSKD